MSTYYVQATAVAREEGYRDECDAASVLGGAEDVGFLCS